MKYQFLISLFILMYCPFYSQAQLHFSFDTGLTSNSLIYHHTNADLDIKSRLGNVYGANLGYKFTSATNLEVGFQKIQKNYSFQNTQRITQYIRNSYLQFPLSVGHIIILNSKIRFCPALGIYYAYWLNSNLQGYVPNVFTSSDTGQGNEVIELQKIEHQYQFDNKDNRSEFGFEAKFGLSYDVNDSLFLLFTNQISRSITSQQRNIVQNQSGRYNNTVILKIGVGYKL